MTVDRRTRTDQSAERTARRGSRRIDKATYDLMLASYRAGPGNVNRASREAEVRWETAKRGWERGWPPHLRPLKEIVQEEQEAARRMVAEQLTDEERDRITEEARRLADLERIKADAVASRRDEALMVRTGRQNVMALMGATAYLTQGALKLGERLQVELLAMAETSGAVDVREAGV